MLKFRPTGRKEFVNAFAEMAGGIRKAIKSLSKFQIAVLVVLLLNTISTLFLLNLAIKQYGKIALLQNQVKTNGITSSINSHLLSNPEGDRLEYRVESIERSLSSHGMPPIPRYASVKEATDAVKKENLSSHFSKAWLDAYTVKEGNNRVKRLMDLHKEFKTLTGWDKKSLLEKLAIIAR
ncbi:hypothetical protein [Acidaminococcus massiliensis]|uniref:hypothetical protein n=1 Tax=Acidaminococcus massiliensis TaxID=1852375 RepID=UPI0022DF5735|nr:hypothetical protein [Acidaminococcus massiliensis]